MIKDEPIDQLVAREVVKTGFPAFDKYLNDTLAKKNEKRRKPNSDNIGKAEYSPANLIRVQRTTLSSTALLAQQLLKTKFTMRQEQEKPEDNLKYQQDFEAGQKLNQKVIKRFLKPVKKGVEMAIGWKANPTPLDVFKTQGKNVAKEELESQLDELDAKHRNRTKLETKKQMTDRADQAMLYLSSDLKVYFCQQQYMAKLKIFNSQLIRHFCAHFRHSLASDGFSTTAKTQIQTQTFSFLIQSLLPSYLWRSEYQKYIPLPWKTNHIQKELARTSFQQITGKVLYRYEHNILELKEHRFKGKMYEIQKRGLVEITAYLRENLNMNKKNHNFDIQIKGSKICKDQINYLPHNLGYKKDIREGKQSHIESKGKSYFAQKIISANLGMAATNKKPASNPQIYEIAPTKITRAPVKSPPNRPKSQNSLAIQNFINIRTKPPQSSLLTNCRLYDELDEYKQSKHEKFIQNPNCTEQNGDIKQKQASRNIVFYKQIQSLPRKKYLDTRNSKALVPAQNSNVQQDEDSQNLSSSSEESKFFDSMTQYKQKKTTKKKKSFHKKTPPQSSLFGVKIKQNRSMILSKKGELLNFYPLRIGNLILERNNNAYLEYNSAKEELKNLTVKFLIDRIKHRVNGVEIVVPSFGLQNPARMKVNDQQKAKEMIKIISLLGGHVLRIKARSEYDEKNSAHESTNRPKISTQIQIYKFFYKEMSYCQIIDTLNLEKQWLQSERDNRKLGGWKY